MMKDEKDLQIVDHQENFVVVVVGWDGSIITKQQSRKLESSLSSGEQETDKEKLQHQGESQKKEK